MYESTKLLNKVLASTLGGAITVILVWLLNTYAGADVPPEVAQSFTVIVTAVIAYAVPIAPGEVKRIQLDPHPIDTAPEEVAP
jgi:hypothetical protein